MEERLQKILARAGYGSRRANEELISAGRVSVNGKTAVLGDKADPQQDRILVDGKPIRLAEELVYIAIYKPRGVLSAVSAPDPRSTVVDLVTIPEKIYPVGRLDVDSEGLMLLTNDGQLANELTHPRFGHEKEYRVLVARRPDEEQLNTWRRGVVLEDGYRTAPADVRLEQPFGKGAWLRVILREGRKRQIRETGSQLGLPVVRIIRIRIGNLLLGALKPKEWRRLTTQEVLALRGPRPSQTPGRKERQGAGGRPPGGGRGPRSGPPRRSTSSSKPPARPGASKKTATRPSTAGERDSSRPYPPAARRKEQPSQEGGKSPAGAPRPAGSRGASRPTGSSSRRPGRPTTPSGRRGPKDQKKK